MSFKNLLNGFPGSQLFKNKLNGDARACNYRLAHHYGGIRLNKVRVHNGSDYILDTRKP